MNKYKELERMTREKPLPLMGENADGEPVIVELETNARKKAFKLTTAQENDVCKINYIYEDGTEEELFER